MVADESVEMLAAMDPTQTMRPSKRKKIKRAKRELIGYDATAPQMCSNCAHFKNAFHSKQHGEYFPPRCERYKLAVERHAVCDHWEDA